MDLLKYEFIDAPEGSYNFILSELVKSVRYCVTELPAEEFRRELPRLRRKEAVLHEIDQELSIDERNYIQEIVAEIKEETEMEEKLFDELEWATESILTTVVDEEVIIEDYYYELKKNRGVYWIEYHGKTDAPEKINLIVKEIFKSVCYRYGIVVIDGSVSNYK